MDEGGSELHLLNIARHCVDGTGCFQSSNRGMQKSDRSVFMLTCIQRTPVRKKLITGEDNLAKKQKT